MSSQAPYLPLVGKTAIVTGGSRGIGEGIAYELAKRGADVITIHRTSSPSTALLQRISSLPRHPRIFDVCGDLSKEEEPGVVMDTIKHWFSTQSPPREPKIDILVNNAGVELKRPLASITPSDFSKIYDLNVRGTLLITQAVLPYLPPGGRIINIGSVAARAGFAGFGLYCSSKAAIEGLTRCWAAELGGNGTTVNCVNPGPVESDMLNNIPKELVDWQKASTPLENRVASVEEVASIVGWLSGEESKWVTGQTISASGGFAMY